MKGISTAALLVCGLLLGPGALPARANHDIDRNELLRRIDRYYQEKALQGIGHQLKEAFLRGEPGMIANYVRGPLLCRHNTLQQQKVLADLKNPSSEIYVYFFDPEGYRKRFPNRPGRPMALKEFFQKATDLRIVVSAPEIVTGGISFQSKVSPVSPYFDMVYHRTGWAFSGLGFPGCED
ncbi:MAG TPA: hypothetical protein VFO18_05165 [Methylomirabilota bacterium]|nr:hypothetical protein [Methylomirabilota bacterium]